MGYQEQRAALPSGSDRALFDLVLLLRQSGYRFVTVSPSTHALVNGRSGNEFASDLSGVFGWSRPFWSGVVADEVVALMEAAGILVRKPAGFRSAVRVSSLAGELFVHSAYPTTAAESVFFGPDTYRFANAIVAWLQNANSAGLRRAVDIGCGAGPGGIVVAKAVPQAETVMVDINEAALRFARINAALAGTGKVSCCRSDLLHGVEGKFDLIVSNPPYLNDPLRRAYRHGGGALGAGLSEMILDTALGRLAAGGTLILYTGAAIVNGADPFRAHVAERLGQLDVAWTYAEMDPDVFGDELGSDFYATADRIAAVVLTVTSRVG